MKIRFLAATTIVCLVGCDQKALPRLPAAAAEIGHGQLPQEHAPTPSAKTMDLAFDVVYGRDTFTIANSHIKIDCRRGDRFVWDERPAPLQLVVSGDQPYTTSQQIVVSYKSEYYDYLCISYEYAPGAGGSGAGCLEIRYGDEKDPCAADAPRIWRFRVLNEGTLIAFDPSENIRRSKTNRWSHLSSSGEHPSRSMSLGEGSKTLLVDGITGASDIVPAVGADVLWPRGF